MFDYSKDYIYVVKNFMSEEDIDAVTKYMEKYPESDQQREIEFLEQINDEYIVSIIKKYEKKAYIEIIGKYAPSLDLRIESLPWIRRLELVKWNHGLGLDPHRDGHLQTPPEPELSISSLIYLTDKYDGGEVYFEEYDINFKPERGDFIVFPSHFLHEVKATQENEGKEYRYTIPFFYTFNARKFSEYTHSQYIKQIEDHNNSVGEYHKKIEIEREYNNG